MTTLIVNKATAKDINLLIDIAKKIGIVLEIAPKTGLNAPVVKPNKLMQDFETACKQLKQSRLRKTKRKSLDELLNEK